MMKTTITIVGLGAALLLTASWGAGAQEGLFTSERDCTSRSQVPYARASSPAEGHIRGLLAGHM